MGRAFQDLEILATALVEALGPLVGVARLLERLGLRVVEVLRGLPQAVRAREAVEGALLEAAQAAPGVVRTEVYTIVYLKNTKLYPYKTHA